MNYQIYIKLRLFAWLTKAFFFRSILNCMQVYGLINSCKNTKKVKTVWSNKNNIFRSFAQKRYLCKQRIFPFAPKIPHSLTSSHKEIQNNKIVKSYIKALGSNMAGNKWVASKNGTSFLLWPFADHSSWSCKLEERGF